MVYEGFQRYGGVEVVNHERLAAYVEHGMVPTGLSVTVDGVCEGLAGVVTADGEYRTPLQDEAPWVDLDDPDTWDFAGVLSLGVTGVDDTTRTVAMTETVRDGALPGSARRGPRTVAQTALLVGRTTEGVQAGLAWLQRALHGSCEQAELDCGPAATLEVFTACPGPIVATANTSVPPATMTYRTPTDTDNPSYDWSPQGGSFTDADDDGTRLVPYLDSNVNDGGDPGMLTPAAVVLDGGDSDDPTVTVQDGGGADAQGDPIIAGGAYPEPDPGETVDSGGAGGSLPVISGGDASPTPGDALLAGAAAMCTSGPATIAWALRRDTTVPVSVQLVIVDDSGAAVEFGPKVDLTDEVEVYTWDLPFGIDHDTWRPGITTAYPVVVQSVTTTTYPDNSPLDCVAPYQRFLPNAVTVTGPSVVEEVDAGCAVLLKVEWSWVVGSPYRYGSTRTVLAGLSADTDASLVLPGVTWARALADPVTVVDDGTDQTLWASPGAVDVQAYPGPSILVISPYNTRPVVTRTAPLDVTTQRYVTVEWSAQNVTYDFPQPGITLTSGATTVTPTLVGTTAGPNGINRSTWLVSGASPDTYDKITWTSNFYTARKYNVSYLFFYRVTTSAVADPAPATVAATPWNCAPPGPVLSCATDPGAPGFSAPPALPYLADPNRPRITTQQVHDLTVCVGPEQTPGNDGVFTFSLAASNQPVVGARVRVWDDVAGDCTVDDPCGFAYEYLIDYVPAGGVLTIDGPDSSITTLCDGGAVLADASGSVAGDYGGPTKEPLARCNRRYFIRVQWLATYPRTVATVYTQGQPQGDLTLAVAVTGREG